MAGKPSALLDFDGTLSDLYLHVDWAGMKGAVAQLYLDRGVPKELLDTSLTTALNILYDIYPYTRTAMPDRAAALHEEASTIVERYERAAIATTRPLPYCFETLRLLRKEGLPIGIITNNTESVVKDIISGWGAAELVDGVVGRRTPDRMKPNPHQILEFARKTGVDPGRSFLVGDTTKDIGAAHAAHAMAIAILTGVSSVAELRAAGPDLVVNDLHELMERRPWDRPGPATTG